MKWSPRRLRWRRAERTRGGHPGLSSGHGTLCLGGQAGGARGRLAEPDWRPSGVERFRKRKSTAVILDHIHSSHPLGNLGSAEHMERQQMIPDSASLRTADPTEAPTPL